MNGGEEEFDESLRDELELRAAIGEGSGLVVLEQLCVDRESGKLSQQVPITPKPAKSVPIELEEEIETNIRPITPPSTSQSPHRYFMGEPPPKRCNRCNEIGHFARDCPLPPTNRICFFCSQYGHMARDCPARTTKLFCYNCGEKGHIGKECVKPHFANDPRVRVPQPNYDQLRPSKWYRKSREEEAVFGPRTSPVKPCVNVPIRHYSTHNQRTTPPNNAHTVSTTTKTTTPTTSTNYHQRLTPTLSAIPQHNQNQHKRGREDGDYNTSSRNQKRSHNIHKYNH